MKQGHWFKHSCQASMDPRMQMLKKKMGYAGIGIFWEIVEWMDLFGGGWQNRKTICGLAYGNGISSRKVGRILDEFFLFESNQYGRVRLSEIPIGECDKTEFEEMMKKTLKTCSQEPAKPSNSEE